MAQDYSFDIVSKVDLQEVKNAIQQGLKEVSQRFDFKGSKCDITLDEENHSLELMAEDSTKLRNLVDILKNKLAKRQVPLSAMEWQTPEASGGGNSRQKVTMQNGIPVDKAKDIVKRIKKEKFKVQAAIQSDQVRVSAKKKDDLQAVMEFLRKEELGFHTQFVNRR